MSDQVAKQKLGTRAKQNIVKIRQLRRCGQTFLLICALESGSALCKSRKEERETLGISGEADLKGDGASKSPSVLQTGTSSSFLSSSGLGNQRRGFEGPSRLIHP